MFRMQPIWSFMKISGSLTKSVKTILLTLQMTSSKIRPMNYALYLHIDDEHIETAPENK